MTAISVWRHDFVGLNHLFLVLLQFLFELSKIFLEIHFRIIGNAVVWFILLSQLLSALLNLIELRWCDINFFLFSWRIVKVVFIYHLILHCMPLHRVVVMWRREGIIRVSRRLISESIVLLVVIRIALRRWLDNVHVWLCCHLSSLSIITTVCLRIEGLHFILKFLVLVGINRLIVFMPFWRLIFSRAVLPTIMHT